jgi:hypothetical protein
MTPEIITILTIGVTLGSGQLATVLWITGRFERVEKSIAERFERMEKSIAERFERMEKSIAERFERSEQRSVERFDLFEQRSSARFEHAERNSVRRFEQLQQGAAEIRERLAKLEGLVEGGVMRRASGTSRDPNRAEQHAPTGRARQAT